MVDDLQNPALDENHEQRRRSKLERFFVGTLEAVCAGLLVVEVGILLLGVVMRYFFHTPLIWTDELGTLLFIWLAMLGSVLAVERNEHMRITLMLNLFPARLQPYLQTTATLVICVFLASLVMPAYEHMIGESFITTPALRLPNSVRIGAMLAGIVLMLLLILPRLFAETNPRTLLASVLTAVAVAAVLWFARPVFDSIGNFSLLIFLVIGASVCLMIGVPIAFCFGAATLAFLFFSTNLPVSVIVGRMDEGMSGIILLSVPIFVLLGCVLDATGMGKAIVEFVSSLVGHLKAGMSYVLLGALFLVSGISGSKVSDMATVAPALFPEMERRGHKKPEMVALLATGAAMADTVPPSIVLIVLGSVAGVSIAGLFTSGFVIAMVLLVSLAILARWKARNEFVGNFSRAPLKMILKTLVIAAPALVLPFLIRGMVGGGIATATEVSTIAVLYAMIVGAILYGGIGIRRIYSMLVETASLTGAILLILGTASAMAWAVTQSGMAFEIGRAITDLPGGWMTYMLISIAVFLVLGCVLEGLPAIVLMAPIMFPIARNLGIHDVHYAMVVVTAMNIGLMTPPIGIGYYLACKIGGADPNDVIGNIFPYLLALLVGLIVIAAVPAISIGYL